MKRYLLIGLLILIGISPAIAQKQGQTKLDSLLSVLPAIKEDTNDVKLLNAIAFSYATIDPAKGLQYANQELALAKKIRWRKGEAMARRDLGSNAIGRSEYPVALNHFLEALKINEELGDNQGIASSLLNIGTVYHSLKQEGKALAYELKSLKIAQENHLDNIIQKGYGNVANIYMMSGALKEALQYQEKALQMATQRGDSEGVMYFTGNMANTYSRLKDDNNAERCYKRALTLAEELGDEESIANNLGNLGAFYYEQAMNEGVKKTSGAQKALLNKASGNLERAVVIARQKGYRRAVMEYSHYLAVIYDQLGDYKNALNIFEQYTLVKDSIFNEDNKETVKALEDKREIELRDKQLKISALELTSQKRQRYLYLGGLATLALIGGLFFKQSSARRKTNLQLQTLNAQLDTNNKQLDEANRVKTRFFGILSHDLRAPISNLTSYLYLQREAPEMMDSDDRANYQLTIENAANNLLAVMEDLLLWSKGQMTSFRPQIHSVQVVQLFDEIKKLIPHDTAINVVFNDPGLLTMNTDEHFLKTIMRNLTANALAALNNQPNGKIDWNAWEESGTKYLSITDNGPGLTKAQQDGLFAESAVTSLTAGLGLHIVRDFVQMLGQKIEVRSEAGKGTTFLLSSAA